MALTDFLTEGAEIPAGSAITSMTKQTVLPDWYTNYAKNLLASQEALSAQPYTPYQGPRVAGFTPDQTGSFAATRDAATAYQPGLNTAQDWLTRAQGMSATGAATPGLNQATGAAGAAVASGGGLSAAMPWLTGASGDVTDVSKYMDPYQKNVTDRIAELGQRNLQDVLLPGVEGRYIRAGQFGGSGKMTDTMRAIRDTSSDILGKQAEYLSSGYKTAQEMKGTDLNRLSQLGATAGSLGTSQQQAALEAAKLYGQTGETLGRLTGEDATRTASNAAQEAALAAQRQQLGLAGAGALNTVGGQQQALNQQNLTTAYEDFLRQQGYPQEQIDKMTGTLGAVGKAIPTATTEEGISPSGIPATYQPGTAESIAGALSGLGGIVSDPSFQTFLKGLGIGG